MQLRSAIRNRRFSAWDYAFSLSLLATMLMLIAGLTVVAFTNDRVAQDAQSFSIIGGAIDLGASGSVGFMVIILLFSAVFPISKLAAMLVLWLFQFEEDTEERTMHWLEILGKWSMLDVFVLATTIGAAHLEMLNRTTLEVGVYLFGLAILLSMVISLILRQILKTRLEPKATHIPRAERLMGLAISTGSLCLFFFGVTLPLFSIEKWVFWNKEYSLITALPKMLAEGQYLLPAFILVFVLVLPLCRFIGLSASRLQASPPAWLVRLAFGLEKWTMWEVYALALIIVAIKLADFTTLTFQLGFWLIVAMVPLSLIDGWLFKRRLELKQQAD